MEQSNVGTYRNSKVVDLRTMSLRELQLRIAWFKIQIRKKHVYTATSEYTMELERMHGELLRRQCPK